MKVILLENIKGVGKKDDIINANDGYARNFLIPNKKAVEASAGNLAKLKSRQESNAYKRGKEQEEAEKIKKQIEGINLIIKVKAGKNGKIFGGVTSKEVSEELEKQYKIKIDKKKIDIKNTIKTLGVFNIDIKLFEGIQGRLKVQVISE